MTDKPTNIGASVRQRLRNLADKSHGDFQMLLRRFVLERVLFRLSVSRFRDDFVLKGAMLQAVWMENPFRNTRDLDLLARGEEDAERAYAAFRAIFETEVPDDGVTFDMDGLMSRPIRQDASYGGIRLKTTAKIGGARVPVVIDIGFGDAVTPKPEVVEYPSLLDLPKPRLLVYPRETVVAEKFEAMISLGLDNSRMKDFHDVAVLASQFEFEGQVLTHALAATFKRRGTALPTEQPVALTGAFTRRLETASLWKGFVDRESIQKDYADLDANVRLLNAFLLAPARAAAEQTGFANHWPAGGPWTD